MRRRRESRPAVRKLIDIHFCSVLPLTCLFLSFPPSLLPPPSSHPFFFSLSPRLARYLYIPRIGATDRGAATSITSDGSNERQRQQRTAGAPRRTVPRRETRHNGRNKWRSFIPAVVIIKWWMPQSSLRSISNDYARLNGSDYGHRTGSP